MDIIITILLSSFKFAMTFPLAILEFGFSFFETILWINTGGLLGILFFAYLSEKVLHLWNHWTGKRKRRTPGTGTPKKVFSRRNRRIIRIKRSYGLAGIAVTTPLLLSIPVGVFLTIRYYSHTRMKLLYLVLSNLGWSVIYTSFYMFWRDLLFPG